MTNDSSRHDEDSIYFIVTGFGPFQGVKDNPTSIIAALLVDYLEQHTDWATPEMVDTRIIETSAEAAREETDSLLRDLKDKERKAVLLHLGVDCNRDNFYLEQCAYNEANFRIPDERGFQPSDKSVSEGCASILRTPLDLEAVRGTVNDKEMVQISTDPGRFVCNYTYFCSLQKFQENDRVFPLFLHVPSFSKVSQEKQLKIIACIMTAIRHEIRSK